MPEHLGHEVRFGEWGLPSKTVVENAAEAVDISANVRAASIAGLFRRQIVGRSKHRTFGGQLRVDLALGGLIVEEGSAETDIEYLDRRVEGCVGFVRDWGEHQVGRFHIAMHHPASWRCCKPFRACCTTRTASPHGNRLRRVRTSSSVSPSRYSITM